MIKLRAIQLPRDIRHTYIFNDSNEYDVFIDLNNLSVVDMGVEMNYYYFEGTFETLDEVQVFIDAFKINETTEIQ